MIAHPVGRYLIQFGLEKEVEPEIVTPFAGVMQPLTVKAEEIEDNREELLEAAREEGRNEARAEVQAYFDATIAGLKIDYEKQLAEDRQAWVTEEGTKLSAVLTLAITQLKAQLETAVDAVMRPFLIESIRAQILDDLAANVNILLAGDCPAIEISGAADLLSVLQEKLSAAPATIEYKPNESIDVRIVAHHTVIESQLGAWIERFAQSKE